MRPKCVFVGFPLAGGDGGAHPEARIALTPLFLHAFWVFLLLQFIFRKIADVRREQERQRTEVSLTIPDDHPVRKLFQKFRQQRDAQIPGEPAAHSDHNCVQVESHQHTQDQAAGSAAQPPEKSCVSEARGRVEGQKVGGSSAGSASDGDGAAGRGAGCRGARGWAKFRNATSAAPPPAAVEKPQPQREEEPSEQLGGSDKKQDPEEMEGAEGGTRAGEEGVETSTLHKTDSCDSGITERIDRTGDSRSSFEKSPMEKSPAERNPFEQTLGVDPLKHSSVPPPSEQTLLQALLHQAKLELKADIQILSGRLSILESQVSEILRLLSIRRRLSLPPISSPRLRGKGQDLAAAAAPALTEADD